MKSDLVDISCRVAEREKSIAITDGTIERVEADGGGKEREKWFWLPLSQIEVEEMPDGSAIVTMPEWLATEKGLI